MLLIDTIIYNSIANKIKSYIQQYHLLYPIFIISITAFYPKIVKRFLYFE